MKTETCRAVVLVALAVSLFACGNEEPVVQPSETAPTPTAATESAAPAAASPPVGKSTTFTSGVLCQLITADDLSGQLGRGFDPGKPSGLAGCRFESSDRGDRTGVTVLGSGHYSQTPEDVGKTGPMYERKRAQGESCKDKFADIHSLPVRAFRTSGCGGSPGSRVTFEVGPQVVIDLVVEGDPEVPSYALESLARRAIDRAKAL